MDTEVTLLCSDDETGGAIRRGLWLGQLYHYSRQNDPDAPLVNGLPNLRYHTHDKHFATQPWIARGFNNLRGSTRSMSPLALLITKLERGGTATTPWFDYFDLRRGYGRYFGDASTQTHARQIPATNTPANRLLWAAWERGTSSEAATRRNGPPLICLRQHRPSIYEFLGVAVVEDATAVAQWDIYSSRSFTNLRFELCILDLAAEDDFLNWRWLNERRHWAQHPDNPDLLAPAAWRRWVEGGHTVIEQVRRRVIAPPRRSKAEQLPTPKSPLERILLDVYAHFGSSQHEFEFLAAAVIAHVLAGSGNYRHGWVTRRSGDFGIDFVGALRVGVPPAATELVLLGQAKCEAPSRSTSARDVARIVARLRRGWIGAYVTTGWFTPAMQQELARDEYPVLLLSGVDVAQAVMEMMLEAHVSDVAALVQGVDRTQRDAPPEDALLSGP